MKNHNLTPHQITIFDEQSDYMDFPASGIVARMSSKKRKGMGYVPFAHEKAVNGVHPGYGGPAMGAMSPPEFCGIDPESIAGFAPSPGDLIIVSAFCGTAAADLWPDCWVVSPDTSPGRCERDSSGMITGSHNWILYGSPEGNAITTTKETE